MFWSLLAVVIAVRTSPYLWGGTSALARKATARLLSTTPVRPDDASMEALIRVFVRRDRWIVGLTAAAVVAFEVLLASTTGGIPPAWALYTPDASHGLISLLLLTVVTYAVSMIAATRVTLRESEGTGSQIRVARGIEVAPRDYVMTFERVVPMAMSVVMGVVAIGVWWLPSSPHATTAQITAVVCAAVVALAAAASLGAAAALARRPQRAGSRFDVFGLDLLRASGIRWSLAFWLVIATMAVTVSLVLAGTAVPDDPVAGLFFFLTPLAALFTNIINAIAVRFSGAEDYFVSRLWQQQPVAPDRAG